MKNKAWNFAIVFIFAATIVALLVLPTALSTGPSIQIHSPENTTYFEKDVALRFEVDEPPILVGYQLDSEETQWFMVYDNRIAPVLKKKKVELALAVHGQTDEIVIRFPESNGIGFQNFYNRSGILEAEFAIIDYKTQSVSKYVHRASNTTPPLKIGIDLELLPDFVIVPSKICNPTICETIDLVVARKSDFIKLTSETLFEFNLENTSIGKHKLTVFVVNSEGVERSVSTNFTVEEPDIVVLANSIDYTNAIELLSFRKDVYPFEVVNLFDYLSFRGFESFRATNETSTKFKDEKTILILGGPDAPLGIGEIVRDVLSQEEQALIRENGSRKMFVKENVWAEDQIVMIVAGNDRWQTQKAVGENGTNVENRLLTKDLGPVGQTWVEIDPVQCGGNQWEKDWARSHNKSVDDETSDLTGYPRHSYPFTIEQSQIDIITAYFKKQGILVSDVRSKSVYGATLDCCGCPRGDRLWLLVSNPDVHNILDLGKNLGIGYKISTEPST